MNACRSLATLQTHVSRHSISRWNSSRLLSSKQAQPTQGWIPAHVVAFTVIMIPALLFTGYAERYGTDEEALKEKLKERYNPEIRQASNKEEQMKAFFAHAIRQHDDQKIDTQLEEVLRAGKGGKKRLHQVDEKFYGTAEGVAGRIKAEEEVKEKKKRKKKKQQEQAQDTPSEESSTLHGALSRVGSTLMVPWTRTKEYLSTVDTKSAAAVTAVASIAALAGYFAGGGNKR